MQKLLLLSLMLALIAQGPRAQTPEGASPVEVRSFKYSKSRRAVAKPDNSRVTPAPSVMLPGNRNFERNRRVNDQAGVRDPNADTLDGRSAALEKSVQDSRAPKTAPVEGYLYQVKIHNASAGTIEVLFFEYQFTERSNPSNMSRRQFLCGVNLKANKGSELEVFSTLGPSEVVSVGSLANKDGNLFEERVLINRIEYADGSIWQRKDWSYAEMRPAIEQALATPWGREMCRVL